MEILDVNYHCSKTYDFRECWVLIARSPELTKPISTFKIFAQ